MKAQGVDALMEKFRGYFVHKDTPKDTVEAIAASLKKVQETPDFTKWAQGNHMMMNFQGPADFAESVTSDTNKFKAFFDEIGLKPKE